MAISSEDEQPGRVHVVELTVRAWLLEPDESPCSGKPAPEVTAILAGGHTNQQQCDAEADELFQLVHASISSYRERAPYRFPDLADCLPDPVRISDFVHLIARCGGTLNKAVARDGQTNTTADRKSVV